MGLDWGRFYNTRAGFRTWTGGLGREGGGQGLGQEPGGRVGQD